jgi:hypothetical protein
MSAEHKTNYERNVMEQREREFPKQCSVRMDTFFFVGEFRILSVAILCSVEW